MTENKNDLPEAPPVCVIESIPVAGEHQMSPAEMSAEGVPAPEHLRLFPELARGAWGASTWPLTGTCSDTSR